MRSALSDLSASLADTDGANAVREYLRRVDEGIVHSKLDAMDRTGAARFGFEARLS
jgi:hypothetical protein